MAKSKINWDKLGATTSIICAIHCMALPLILTSLPILGIDLVDNKYFEMVMIALAFIIGIIALSKGKKKYTSPIPILLFSIGITFLLLKEFYHQWHNILLVPAIIFILISHYANYKMMKSH